MIAAHTLRVSDRSDGDLDALIAILRESQRILDPDFLEAGLGFDPVVWGRTLRDPQTEWVFLHAPDGAPAGFAGWRLNPTQCHLHALFVAAPHQRSGYGHALLEYHWQAALRRQPDIQRFTLHVRQVAYWARRLYESVGYQYYQGGDEARWPALQVWIANCQEYGAWPLPAAKLLMHRPAVVAPAS
jgi:GNAT superfamily N-acetyltransferase